MEALSSATMEEWIGGGGGAMMRDPRGLSVFCGASSLLGRGGGMGMGFGAAGTE